MQIFTSAAPNYVGKVRALCHSLEDHCPEARVIWLVADRRDEALREAMADDPIDELLFLDDFDEFCEPAWQFQHSLVELCTAIKPTVALRLLEREDCDRLIYFDPDQVLFSPLDDLFEELSSASAVLTPHILTPYEDLKSIVDHEVCALRNGIFNLGFFGIRDCVEGRAFLAWWGHRCLHFCRDDWQAGLFTDQKWINHAPIFFPGISTLRSTRFNVAPWNIGRRHLEGTFDEGFKVDGQDLGFYHFTGLDSGAHQEVIDWYAEGNSAVHGLVRWYVERSRDLVLDLDLRWSLGTFDNGELILPVHRSLYRNREDLQAAFTNPFATSPEYGMSYFEWLRTTGPVECPDMFRDAP